MPNTNIILRMIPQLEFPSKRFLIAIQSLGTFFIVSFPAIVSL